MSDSEEDSKSSENNWPMNEDWLIGILKGDNQTDDNKVEIKVRTFQKIFFLNNNVLIISLFFK